VVAGGDFFPLAIRFGKPTPTAHFDQLQKEFTALREAEKRLGFKVEWCEKTTSRWGKQSFPESASFTEEASYLGAIGKKREVEALRSNVALIRKECPELEPWLQKFPHRIAVIPDQWAAILKVCRYYQAHPTPRLYARQLPIGVHSKFIDQNHSILRDLLDFLLGDHVKVQADSFEGRFHLLEAEPTLRFRFLDDHLRVSYSLPLCDVSAPFSEVRGLKFSGFRCLIVENLMIFLTLPQLPNTLAVFGGGKASALITGLPWLKGCQVSYWGDIDDPGYRMLSKLRRGGLSVDSLFMDEETWRQFGHLAHPGNVEPGSLDLHLTPSELNVWKLVRDKKLMLEQELLPQTYIESNLEALFRASA
jgi:hypothetical protein